MAAFDDLGNASDRVRSELAETVDKRLCLAGRGDVLFRRASHQVKSAIELVMQ
jgi:hypothetical protein